MNGIPSNPSSYFLDEYFNNSTFESPSNGFSEISSNQQMSTNVHSVISGANAQGIKQVKKVSKNVNRQNNDHPTSWIFVSDKLDKWAVKDLSKNSRQNTVSYSFAENQSGDVWSKAEFKTLQKQYEHFPNQWTNLQKFLPNHSTSDIKQCAQRLIEKDKLLPVIKKPKMEPKDQHAQSPKLSIDFITVKKDYICPKKRAEWNDHECKTLQMLARKHLNRRGNPAWPVIADIWGKLHITDMTLHTRTVNQLRYHYEYVCKTSPQDTFSIDVNHNTHEPEATAPWLTDFELDTLDLDNYEFPDSLEKKRKREDLPEFPFPPSPSFEFNYFF